MRKWLLVLLLVPAFAMASEMIEDGLSADENEAPTIQSYRCGSFSDYPCWGGRVGMGCMIGNPPNNRWGQCRQTSLPDRRNEVSCHCI